MKLVVFIIITTCAVSVNLRNEAHYIRATRFWEDAIDWFWIRIYSKVYILFVNNLSYWL